MYPVIREVLSDDGPNVASSVTIGSGSQAGDIIVAFVSNDWLGITSVNTPTATGITFTERWKGNDSGTNGLHSKIFTAVLDANGTKNISCAVGSNVDNVFAVAVIDGSTVDPSWFSGATATQALQTTSTSHIIPTITPTGPHTLYLGWATTNASGPATYSVGASGLTEQNERSSRTFITGSVFSGTFAGATATGTKTVTSSVTGTHLTAALAITGKKIDPSNMTYTPIPFVDDFADNDALWTEQYSPLGSNPIPGPQPVGGTLELPLAADGANTGYTGFQTSPAGTLTLGGSSGFMLELVNVPAADATAFAAQVYIYATPAGDGKRVGFEVLNDGILKFAVHRGYYDQDTQSGTPVTFNATTHRWVALIEDAGYLVWYTSPDATVGSWTERHRILKASINTNPYSGSGNLFFSIEGSRATGGSTLYFEVDNLNNIPSVGPEPISWAADLTQVDLDLMGYQNWQIQDDAGVFTNESVDTPPVVSAPGTRPGDALEFTVSASQRRNEVVPDHRDLTTGDSVYFSQSFYLAAGFPTDRVPGSGYDGFQIIDQIHQAWGSYSPPVAFEIVNDSLILSGGSGLSRAPQLGGNESTDASIYAYYMNLGVLITTEQWYDLVYYIENFSEVPGESTITVWLNGVEILSNHTLVPPTLVQGDAAGIESYRKHGIYHSTTFDAATIYQAGMKAGASYAEVDPDDGLDLELSGSGDVSASSYGEGGGIASHTGQGHTVELSAGEGTGLELYGGSVASFSTGEGEGSGGHSGTGDAVSFDGGESDATTLRVDDSTPLFSTSIGNSAVTTEHVGAGQGLTSTSTTTGNGLSQQLGSAGIVRPIIGMAIRLIDENGNAGEFLPHWTDIAFTDKYNGTGTVTFTYAKGGVNADLLSGRRVEGALFDGTFEIPGTRFLVTQSATDGVKEDASGNTIVVNAPLWVPTRLSEATIYPPNGFTADNVKTRFAARSPGYIIGTLLAKAHDRGVAEDIVQNFDSMIDSNNNAWDQVITMEVEPGGSIMSVLDKLTELGVCDWKSNGRELVLLNPDSGTDWTNSAAPINLTAGRDLLDAPEKRDSKRVTTAVLVVGKDGLSTEVEDPAEEAIQGTRIESYLSVNGVDDLGTLTLIGEKYLEASKLSGESLTHELSLFVEDGPIPWVDYTVGDWVYRQVADGNPPQRYRVAQLSCTYSQEGMVKGAVTLGTIYESTAQRLQAQIDALTNGSNGISTGTSDSPPEDTISPKAPEGLIVNSDAYTVDNNGGTMAALSADWLPVIENIDGSTCRDLDGYEVRWRDFDAIGGTFTGDADLGNAAKEILAFYTSGGTLFEDFSFYGNSQNVAEHNDEIASGFNDNFETYAEVVDYLEGVVAENTPASTAGYWTTVGTPNQPTMQWSGVPAGISIKVTVRAKDRSGNYSPWCPEVTHYTAVDDTPPQVPSTPVVTPYLGTLRIDWDGYGAGGVAVPMDADLQGANVEYTDDLDGDWILVDRISPGGGRAVISGDLNYGQTYFVRLVAQDWSGNLSDPSATATGTPEQVVTIDIGPNAIASSQIIDAAIVTAKIANLAVNDAKIANLSVGKLTAGTLTADVTVSGSFNTSTDVNNRVRMDNAGIRMTYAGEDRVLIKPDGTALMTGELRTANSGLRLVWNAGQTRASIQFHSNATTNDTAPSLYVAANNVNANRPAVILDGPTYGRTFAGQQLVSGLVFGDDYGYFAVRTKAASNDDTFEGLYFGYASDVIIRCPGSTGRLSIRENDGGAVSGLHTWNIQCNNIVHSGTISPASAEDSKEQYSVINGLDIVRQAPVYQFKKRPILSTEKDLNEPMENRPFTAGPVAEDLPEWMQVRIEDDNATVQGYDLYALIGTLMQAVRELDEELDQYRNVKPLRVTDLGKRRIGRL